MPEPSSNLPFTARLHSLVYSRAESEARFRAIHGAVLGQSEQIRQANFALIGTRDLELLSRHYDQAYFGGLIREMLQARRVPHVHFRLSRRMTRSAGTTEHQRFREAGPTGPVDVDVYTITVSTTLLYGTFRGQEREVLVGGIAVHDRLEALMRIFEHELIHLAEFLAWNHSNCKAENFQILSRQIFAHEASNHDLITPRERAAREQGIHVGDRVSFEFDGVRRQGIVNRITQRATVLVSDRAGERFRDGERYLVFYVPVPSLRKEAASEAT